MVNNEFKRMQQLAGLLTEVKIVPPTLQTNHFEWDQIESFEWKPYPRNPKDILQIFEDPYSDDFEEITKEYFWETDITPLLNDSSWANAPTWANKTPDGTWAFEWDDSTTVSGFREYDDFKVKLKVSD